MDRVDKQTRSKIMRSIKSKDTKPEVLFRKHLCDRGIIDFVPHYKFAFNADIAFPREKIAIFIDGNFWHGKDFEQNRDKLSGHWQKHIEGNIERDKRNRKLLEDNQWVVLSFWEDEIMSEAIGEIVEEVESVVIFRKNNLPMNRQERLF